MTKLLIRLVENRTDKENQRSAFASLSSVCGIICNILLCAVKFTVGALCSSVAITADAVNNLSDSAVNIVTLTGTKLSDKPDDREHPFGHGRIEYISVIIVAISIFIVSFELGKSSVEKIIHPVDVKYSAVYIAVISATVLVKLWMAYLNSRLYKITDNLNMKAVMQDSLNDSVATAATVVSLILSAVFHIKRIDGITGGFVSVFIFFSGVQILRQVVSPLLGEAPPKEITNKIESIICESDIVLGVHDLVIHSYGANKMLASADAEVDASADVFTIHDVIDAAEKRIENELGIEMCIHTDPVDKSDRERQRYKLIAQGVIKELNGAYSLHDFRLTESGGVKTAEFDLELPFDEDDSVKEELEKKLRALCPELNFNIICEHSYTE